MNYFNINGHFLKLSDIYKYEKNIKNNICHSIDDINATNIINVITSYCIYLL